MRCGVNATQFDKAIHSKKSLPQIACQFQLLTSKQLQASVQYLELSDNERTTAKAILGCYNAASGYGYPSYQTLAKLTGFCERTVIRHVKAIAKLGILVVRHTGYICKRTKQRRQGNNEYVPNFDRIRERMAPPFKAVNRLLSGSSVTGDKSQQINPQQINNKAMPLISFSSIKKMYAKRTGTQAIFSQLGLMFNRYNDSDDCMNAIGYLSHHPIGKYVAKCIQYYRENEPTKVLDKEWLLSLLSHLEQTEAKPVSSINFEHYAFETETHPFFKAGRYFANAESYAAVRERDRQW